MATCKDCLHYKICKAYADDVRGDAYNENELFDDCYGNFKNKSDFQEVKHGYWHLLDNCANEGVYCSVCNKKVYKTDYANQKVKSNYCPNCGARMDGDNNG